MGFWHVYFGIYGGGQADVPVGPTDGWIAETRTRVFVTEVRSRVWIAGSK